MPNAPPAIQALAVTGATGFVGRRLVAALLERRAPRVRLLVRDPASAALPRSLPPGWDVVPADLGAPRWETDLAGIDTVVHLAARTGKARPASHHRDGVVATTALLRAAERSGVRRFLFVSSIAAGFPDRRFYHYANAKAAAESAVLASRLETLIVRPTMVFGSGSPVLAGLVKLASLPRPLMFGAGQSVQPVHVDDLVVAILAALDLDRWAGQTLDYGGPITLPMDQLLARIRSARGLPARRPIRVPLEPLRTLLALAEPLFLPVLPFTAGQLASFANSAAARPDASQTLPAPRVGLEDMIRES